MHPPVPTHLRQAFWVIGNHVDDYLEHARLRLAPEELASDVKTAGTKVLYTNRSVHATEWRREYGDDSRGGCRGVRAAIAAYGRAADDGRTDDVVAIFP